MLKNVLLSYNTLTPNVCARFAETGVKESLQDWHNECDLFNVDLTSRINEEWLEAAWENNLALHVDKRSEHLDKHVSFAGPFRIGLYSDRGYAPVNGITFAIQTQRFGQTNNYGDHLTSATTLVLTRLPERYEYEECTIHTAELAAMVASLRWRNKCGWRFVLRDRSAIFNALQHALEINSSWPAKGT